MDVVGLIAIGVAAGVFAGLFGIGGGALFVPALVFFVDLGQVDAEATSLLAMIPVAIVGAWRQRGYGNVRESDALALGVLAVGGGVLGVVVANSVSERALEVAFAVFMLFTASQLVRRALSFKT
jgi:uncharacterized membrane protein YfcA